MGLFLVISMIISFGIMVLEFAIIGTLTLGVTYAILRCLKCSSSKTIDNSIITVSCVVALAFITTYGTYFQYVTRLDFSRESAGVNKDSFWYKKTNGDFIGSLFILNLLSSKAQPNIPTPRTK